MTNEQIAQAYAAANAEKFACIDWLISQGTVRTELEGARYLQGPAGAYALQCYRKAA